MRPFNPEMLILARESRGLTQTQLAQGVSLQQGSVSKLEAGILPASEEILARLAEALDYPIEFFLLADRVYGFNSAVFFHRKRQALPDRVLRKLHAFMNLARMRVSRLLVASEVSSQVSFQRIELSDYKNDPEQIAQIVRATWLVPMGPVQNVTEAIENAGGIVVRMDFGTKQADAISEWIPGFPPIFLINSDAGIPGDRMRLTLAHEIAHVVMHRFPNPEMEGQANSFAAEFLMPRKQIKASLYNLSLSKLVQLKRIWKVSMAALIHRAFELKTITETQQRYLYINMAKRGYRMREPAEADVPTERPMLLNTLTRTHIDKLGYSVADLMKLVLLRNEDELRSVYLGGGQLRLVG
jgi:Zn-dependent peptidase ImmA (M78 family)/DNA-binding XRE family transcriptional regulator